MIVCSVTGSTQAGMVAGFAAQDRPRRVIGIDGSARPRETKEQVTRIAQATAALIEVGRELRADELVLDDRYHAGTYGIPDAQTIDAIRTAARLEGMLTDPVYEGKSMAGMIDLVRRGEIAKDANVLYAHLGGQPALNAYSGVSRRSAEQFAMFSRSSSSGASTASQAATISRAVSGDVRFRLITSTFASFQRRAPSAIQGSQASAARTPGTLFAAIAVPVPVQQKRRPWSASPLATAPATRAATSGHWSCGSSSTSWPAARSASTAASSASPSSSAPATNFTQKSLRGRRGRAGSWERLAGSSGDSTPR